MSVTSSVVKDLKHSLRFRLSAVIVIVMLISAASIIIFSYLLIERQFRGYILGQANERAYEIAQSLTQAYNNLSSSWNISMVSSITSNAVYRGFIVAIIDERGNTVWDEADSLVAGQFRGNQNMRRRMGMMGHMMRGTALEYTESFEQEDGFTTRSFELILEGEPIGTALVRSYDPFFMSDSDFVFLDSLWPIFLGVGTLSVLIAILVGAAMSRPILTTILCACGVAGQMSGGNLSARIIDESGIKELDDLRYSLNNLAGSLSRQDSLRKQLTADVAHELRTPLTSVSTMIESMIEGVYEPTPKRLQSCYDEVNRISRIIKDLENLAKADNDTLRLQKSSVNLRQLVNSAVESFDAELSAKSITVRITGDCPLIKADGGRIRQVVVNLISNAVKYTDFSGNIDISITTENNGCIRLDICDDGIGISQSDIPNIFERFYRAEKSRSRAMGGSGIGLAIVKSIVQAHGGAVSVSSQLGKGSCFSVILPI